MIITYGIKANNKANSSYERNLQSVQNKGYIFVEVETEDERFFSTDNLKVTEGEVVLDLDKIAEQDKKSQIQALKATRDESLESNTVTMLGHEFDARPKDLSNIQLGIDKNETLWPDVNDYMVDVVQTDLQFLLATGIEQGELIWDNYKQAVKALQST
jgi:protease II